MFEKLWQCRNLLGWKRRFCRLPARSAYLLICWMVLLCGVAGAGDDAISADDAFNACVSQDAEAVLLIKQTPDGVFVGASDQHFIPADIRFAEQVASQEAQVEQTGVSDGPSRFKAIPAGPANRWGLVPAWIIEYRDNARILFQARHLESGSALFDPNHADEACADLLRRVERSARSRNIGIWQDADSSPVRATWKPNEFEGLTGQYVIAQGRIVSLGKTRSTRYLNFGNFWKTDFTVTWKAADEDSFDLALGRSGWRIEDLTGKTVEVRGVVQMRDGPLLALRHPEQLVVLENKRAARAGQNSD